MSSSAKNENTPIIPPDSIFLSWSLPLRKQTRQILSEALCIFGRKVMLSPPRMMTFMFHQQRQHPDILWILFRSSITSASLFLKETILCFILIIKKFWILSLRESRRILSAGCALLRGNQCFSVWTVADPFLSSPNIVSLKIHH